MRFEKLRLRSVRFGNSRFRAVRIGNLRFGSVRFGIFRFEPTTVFPKKTAKMCSMFDKKSKDSYCWGDVSSDKYFWLDVTIRLQSRISCAIIRRSGGCFSYTLTASWYERWILSWMMEHTPLQLLFWLSFAHMTSKTHKTLLECFLDSKEQTVCKYLQNSHSGPFYGLWKKGQNA